jgi:copper transport protein
MQWWRRGPGLWGLAATLLVTAVVLLPGSAAHAHATLVDSSPASGATLGEPPEEIRLRFTERITVAPDGVRLQDADGAVVDTGPPVVPEDDPTAVVLPVPADLPDGSYVVSFRIVSADSHPVAGALVFGVGVAAGSLDDVDIGSEDPAVAAVFTASRWASYAALALLGGALAVFVLCWPGGWGNQRARRVVLIGWGASLVSGVMVLLLQGPYTSGRSLASLFDPQLLSVTLGTDYGRFVTLRLLVAAAAGAIVLTGHRWPARVRAAGALTVTVALPVTWVGTGHANAASNRFDLVVDATHLVAMSTWFGGLALLALCLLPRTAAVPVEEVGPALRRFSLIATSAVATLVVTGVYLAWQRVGTWDALLGTSYGQLLAFKLAILGVLLWLGALSRGVVQRRYAAKSPPVEAGKPGSGKAARLAEQSDQQARSRLRQSVRLEVGTAVAVLVMASLLVATPPGAVVSAEEARAAAPVPVPVLDEVALDEDRGVLVLVDPAQAGENRVVLEVVDPFGNPREVPELRAAFVLPEQDLGPLPVDLIEISPGVYEAGQFRLPVPGDWRLDVTVRTSEIDSTTAQVDVPVR